LVKCTDRVANASGSTCLNGRPAALGRGRVRGGTGSILSHSLLGGFLAIPLILGLTQALLLLCPLTRLLLGVLGQVLKLSAQIGRLGAFDYGLDLVVHLAGMLLRGLNVVPANGGLVLAILLYSKLAAKALGVI